MTSVIYLLMSILITALYLAENIVRNILLNKVKMTLLNGSILAVSLFSAVILLLTVTVPPDVKGNLTLGSTAFLVITTAVLVLTNLYPFDSKADETFRGNVIQMIFVAAAEELIFRGYVLQFFGTLTNPMAAIILTNVIFGMLHMANFRKGNRFFALLQVIGAIGIGIVYSVAGNLLLSMLSHALINISANAGVTTSRKKETVFAFFCIVLALFCICL